MNIENATTLLELISDKSRLIIIKALLKQRRLCGNDLLKEVECGQSTLSHHMNAMVDAKLVNARKNGNKVIYSLNYDTYLALLNYLGKETELPKFKTVTVKVEKPVEVEKPKPVEKVKPVEVEKPQPAKEEPKKDDRRVRSVPTYLL